MILGLTEFAADSKSKAANSAPAINSGALKIWREKLEYLEQQSAVTSSPAQKFELQFQIQEAKEKIQDLGG